MVPEPPYPPGDPDQKKEPFLLASLVSGVFPIPWAWRWVGTPRLSRRRRCGGGTFRPFKSSGVTSRVVGKRVIPAMDRQLPTCALL